MDHDYFVSKGQVRNDYSEIWIILPFIIIGVLIAVALVTPVIIHQFCRSCCSEGFCEPCWICVDHFVQSCASSFNRYNHWKDRSRNVHQINSPVWNYLPMFLPNKEITFAVEIIWYQMADDTASILYITIPIILTLVLIALCFTIPLLARRYCQTCCPVVLCPVCCMYVEFCLQCGKQCDNGCNCSCPVTEDY